MIEVVYKSCVHCRHHPHVGFLYSFSVLVFGINKYPVVCLVAGDVCVLLDGVAEHMVKVLEKPLRLSEQAMRRSLVHVETVVVEELHDSPTGIAYMYLSCAMPAMNEPSYCELRNGASGALPGKYSSFWVYVRT